MDNNKIKQDRNAGSADKESKYPVNISKQQLVQNFKPGDYINSLSQNNKKKLRGAFIKIRKEEQISIDVGSNAANTKRQDYFANINYEDESMGGSTQRAINESQ